MPLFATAYWLEICINPLLKIFVGLNAWFIDLPDLNYRFPTVTVRFPIELFCFRNPVYPILFSRPAYRSRSRNRIKKIWKRKWLEYFPDRFNKYSLLTLCSHTSEVVNDGWPSSRFNLYLKTTWPCSPFCTQSSTTYIILIWNKQTEKSQTTCDRTRY